MTETAVITPFDAGITHTARYDGKHNWSFLLSPAETWEAVYKDCATAKVSIDFEQYIFRNDDLGKRFLELFERKVKEGIIVRIIFDPFGSLGPYYSPSLVHNLRKVGVRVSFYHPFRFYHLLMPWVIFPRTHSKTMLIDSRIAYVGGVCFAGEMRNWRDTQVRITGPVVKEIHALFTRLWARKSGRRAWRKKRKQNYTPHSTGAFRLVTSTPRLQRNPIYEALRAQIRLSKTRVYLTTPYFIPSRSFIKLLGLAARRGVDVRVMIPEQTDVRLSDFASRSYFSALLARGIRIYLYEKDMLHAKTTVIDEDWATIGSMNLDYLSVFYNREVNLTITDKAAVSELAQHFHDDLKHCRQFTVADWRGLPLPKLLLYSFSRLFHPVL